MPTIEGSRELVSRLFAGVTDKAGVPYVEHCERVMALLPEDATEDEKHAALLHDVFEDTDLNGEELAAAGYSEAVVELVVALTKHPAESYTAYISRIAGTPAERIKRADLADNSDGKRLAALNPAVRFRLAEKYAHALSILDFARNHRTAP